jgi:hypothetical protein
MSLPSFDNIIDTLNTGQVSPICDCCPCSNVYFFMSVDKALQFFESVSWPGYSDTCTGNPRAWYSDCCITTCFDELSAFLGQERTNDLLNAGVVEYSLLGDKSTLCLLYDYIIKNNISQDDALQFILDILETGIVFYCKQPVDGSGGLQLLASKDTFLQHIEANFQSPFCDYFNPPEDVCQCYPQEGCCLTVKASVQTYNSWNQIFSIG